MYSQEFIDTLMSCPKKVTQGWREVKDARHGIKKVFEMESADGNYQFSGFYTQNSFFQEDFSIGLVYVSKTEMGKVLLIRCNGLHGGTNTWGHHAYTHTHKPSVAGLNLGNKEPIVIERIEEYTTLETALQYFARLINIEVEDRKKHFPAQQSIQKGLFDDPEE